MSAIEEDFTQCFELELCKDWQLHVCVNCFAEVLLQNDGGMSGLCQSTASQDVLGKQGIVEMLFIEASKRNHCIGAELSSAAELPEWTD